MVKVNHTLDIAPGVRIERDDIGEVIQKMMDTLAAVHNAVKIGRHKFVNYPGVVVTYDIPVPDDRVIQVTVTIKEYKAAVLIEQVLKDGTRQRKYEMELDDDHPISERNARSFSGSLMDAMYTSVLDSPIEEKANEDS